MKGARTKARRRAPVSLVACAEILLLEGGRACKALLRPESKLQGAGDGGGEGNGERAGAAGVEGGQSGVE